MPVVMECNPLLEVADIQLFKCDGRNSKTNSHVHSDSTHIIESYDVDFDITEPLWKNSISPNGGGVW